MLRRGCAVALCAYNGSTGHCIVVETRLICAPQSPRMQNAEGVAVLERADACLHKPGLEPVELCRNCLLA